MLSGGEMLYLEKFLITESGPDYGSWKLLNGKKICLDYGSEGNVNPKDLNTGHWWYYDGSLHYDAENPEGVEDFLELSFFRKQY